MDLTKQVGLFFEYPSLIAELKERKQLLRQPRQFKLGNENDPKYKYTNRERHLHYWNNVHSFKSIQDVIKTLGFYDRINDKVIIPQAYMPAYNRFIKEHTRVSNKYTKSKVDYTVLKVDKTLGSYVPTKEELEYVSPPVVKKTKTKFNYRDFDKLVKFTKEFSSKLNKLDFNIRDETLLTKLRNKIWLLRFLRASKLVRHRMLENKARLVDEMSKAVPQMSDEISAQGEKICPQIDSKGNVLLETQRGESQGIPAQLPKNKLYRELASAESSPDYGDLVDRYYPHETYFWKGSSVHPSGHVITSLSLPKDFIVKHPDSPNCILFNNYGYWDGDMEIKILVNSNKFQVGQLQMAWYYGQDYESNFDRRDNIYTASQQAHCLVSASTSNEGTLYIPFRYYKPKMGTKARIDDPGHLNMGSLSVRVINPLTCPSTTYNVCTYTISFRFVNSNFSGMIARNLGKVTVAEPQMFAVRGAMRALRQVFSDPNRDNPPAIAPPRPMIPWSAHSWAVGDRIVEPINPMRLDGPGQTPHPSEVTPEFDEMKIDYIKQIFGLLFIKKWDAQSRSGTMIFDLDGAPLTLFDNYYIKNFDGNRAAAMPPVAVLSNLFAYWRGSIELRLDVIASPFHTGRLLVAYIPRVIENPTIEQAKCSPHAIFDLQGESRQFSFIVPYIADRPWWQTNAFGHSVKPPSKVYCFILNELIPMDNVVNIVDINVYIRGGPDFEFAIPVSPRIGLCTYNALVKVENASIAKTKIGYTPMYTGGWRYFNGGTKIVLRYREIEDNIVQFEGLKKGVVYEFDPVMTGAYIRGKGDVHQWYIVGISVDATDTECKYATFFSDLAKAKLFAKDADAKHVDNYVSPSGWFDTNEGNPWDKIIYFKPVLSEDFEIIPNMDERQAVTTACEASILPSVPSTSSGLETFGERFNDLKSVCRRYQMYTKVKTKSANPSDVRQCVKIPLLPQGLVRTDDEIKGNEYYNYCREGLIPIIASGYRFYRGGLRFRLVWRASWDCTIRIEHRPDERIEDMSTKVQLDHRGLINDGYAIVIQNTKINNVIEFEIPFYQCGVLGLLQKPKIEDNLEAYHYSLGNIYISFYCSKSLNIEFELFYAIADDCRFSVFQGFPPMIQAPNYKLDVPQMGWLGDLKDTISNSKTITDKFNKMLPDEVEPNMTVEEAQFSLINWITHNVPLKIKAMMVNAVTQLVHCFINPTTKTIVWSISSFFMSIGVLSSDLLFSFGRYMKQLVRHLFVRGSKETKCESPGDIAVPQMSEEQKDANAAKAGIISTVVASIGCLFGNIRNLPKTVPDFFKGMWNGMGKFTFTANHLCTFFKNNLMWLTDCYKWVLSKLMPKRAIATEIDGMDNVVKQFVEEALILTDAKNARKVEVHPRWNLRVYECAATAQILYMRLSTVKNGPSSPALFSLMRSIIKKRDELVKFQLSPPVRFEPYVLNIFGKCNIGKSHLCQEIGKELLKKIEYKTFEELIYTRTPGNPYWNQLRSQPICLFDDFAAIGGDFALQQAAELFCLKSRAVFNPPQAAIEDKHIRYNPLLVFLASNAGFYKIPGVANEDAFYRRRDILVEAIPNADFYREHKVDIDKGSPKDFSTKNIKKFEHLLFKIAEDVKNEKTEFANPMKYEQLIDVITNRFRVFYERELELYKKALKDAYVFYPEDDEFFSVANTLADHTEKLKNINNYRFGSILELKTFIMSYLGALKANKETKEDKYEALIPALRILYAYDTVTTKQIVGGDTILEQLAIKKKLFNFEPPEPSTAVPNMGEKDLVICSHVLFDEEMHFERVDAKDPKSEGFFKSANGTITLSEYACCKECPWSDDHRFNMDMTKWMNATDILERQTYYKNCDYHRIPKIFHNRMIQDSKDKQSKEACPAAIKEEILTWKAWAKQTLSEVGNGLWTVLKWSARVIAMISAIFGVIGLARSALFPERKDIVMAKTLVKDNTYYEIAKQQNKAYYDVEALNQPPVSISDEASKQIQEILKEGQMAVSGDNQVYGKSKEEKQNQIKDAALTFVANLSPDHENNMLRLIKRNTGFIKAYFGTKVVYARILGLSDRIALAVDHYHEKFKRIADTQSDARFEIILYSAGEIPFVKTILYKHLTYKPLRNSSLGIYVLPLSCPNFRRIVQHITPLKAHENMGYDAKLITIEEDFSIIISEQFISPLRGMSITGDSEFEPFVIRSGYKYSKGGKGLCGSILMSSATNKQPMIGMHVAGSLDGGTGYAEILIGEHINQLLEACSIYDVAEPNMAEIDTNTPTPQGILQVLGKVPFLLGSTYQSTSRIIPTECSGKIFPITSEPPVLRSDDPRIKSAPFDPIMASVNKHGCPPRDFPMEYVDRAYSDLCEKVLCNVKPVRGRCGKLPKRSAIVGDPNVIGFEPLDFSTSEGFPYVACRFGTENAKRWLLNVELTSEGYKYNGMDPMLREIIKRKKQQRLNRILPFTVFSDCLKDSKVDKEKVLIPGKTRVFSLSPLDFTIQCRQYMMDFTVSYQNTRFDIEHGIGMDVNSYEWTDLAGRLLGNSNNIITADYSNFGPGLNAICADRAFKIIRRWYKFNGDKSKKNDLVRYMLAQESIFSVHLVRNVIYRTCCGLPSGSPMTVIQNSLVNCIYIRIAWLLRFTSNMNFSTITLDLSHFHKNVKIIVYGDDVIGSVSNEYIDVFNCETIANCLKVYGIDIKNATKREKIVTHNSILDMDTTFLKHRFKPHPNRAGIFLAALEKKSVEDTLNWTYKTWQYKLREISLEACEACLRNAFGHGPDYFNYVSDSIKKFWRDENVFISLPDWQTIDNINYG